MERGSNTVVIYRSKTGFTEKYAKWIAQALSCDIIGNKTPDIKDTAKYDTIIYGGAYTPPALTESAL